MMILLNAVLCMALSYVSFAFLAAGHPPKTCHEMLLHIGLCGCFALYAVAAVLPVVYGVEPAWWTLMVRLSLLIVAAWLYNRRFGLARHARMVIAWIVSRPAAVASLPSRMGTWWSSRR